MDSGGPVSFQILLGSNAVLGGPRAKRQPSDIRRDAGRHEQCWHAYVPSRQAAQLPGSVTERNRWASSRRRVRSSGGSTWRMLALRMASINTFFRPAQVRDVHLDPGGVGADACGGTPWSDVGFDCFDRCINDELHVVDRLNRGDGLAEVSRWVRGAGSVRGAKRRLVVRGSSMRSRRNVRQSSRSRSQAMRYQRPSRGKT